jgi:hypothetical protein
MSKTENSLEKQNGYYGPNGFYEMKGPVAPYCVSPKAKDANAA